MNVFSVSLQFFGLDEWKNMTSWQLQLRRPVKPAEICQFAPCRCPQCRKRKKENGRERQDSFQSITLTGFYTEWRAMHQILGGSPELGIICNNIHSSIHSMAVTFSLSWFSFSHPFLVSFSETILGLIIILIE